MISPRLMQSVFLLSALLCLLYSGAAHAQMTRATTTTCLPATADVVEALQKGRDAVLCPSTSYLIDNTLTFSVDNQKIYTLGKPEGNTRAILQLNTKYQAAIIRTDSNPGLSGLEISNVILDGNRRSFGAVACVNGQDCAPVVILAGVTNAKVHQTKIYDARGWSHLWVGPIGAAVCQNVTLDDNDIGPGGDDHDFSDGISLDCQDSTVQGNRIKDVTDGGIVVFGAKGSTIEENTIVAKNQNMNVGLSLSDYVALNGDRTGIVVKDNRLVANSSGYMFVGIAAGDRLWFGNAYGDAYVYGATIANNVVRGKMIGVALAVSGTKDFTIVNNDIARGILLTDVRHLVNTTLSGNGAGNEKAFDDHLAHSTTRDVQKSIVMMDIDNIIYRLFFLQRQYQALLGRALDSEGVQYWLGVISNRGATAQTQKSITQDILGSEEAQDRLSDMPSADIVTDFYQAVLNRDADAGGLAFWKNRLDHSRARLNEEMQIISEFYNSGEFAQNTAINLK